MKHLLIGVLICVLAVGNRPLHAAEFNEEQWASLFKKKVESTIHAHYLFLSKNFTDAALWMSRELQFDTLNAAATHAQLQALQSELLAGSKRRGEALRKMVLLKAHAEYLSQDIDYQMALWGKLKAIRTRQCTEGEKSTFARDFSISAVLAVRGMLAQLKDQLEAVIAKGSEVYVSVRYHSGGNWQMGAEPGGAGGDIGKWMALGGTIGLGAGSFLGPAGAAVGAVLGTIIGGVLAALFGETLIQKLSRIMQQQADFINAAVTRLEMLGAHDQVSVSCDKFVHRPSLAALYAQVDADAARSANEGRAMVQDFKKLYGELSVAYEQRLATLTEEIFPIALESIDSSFENYFENVEERSKQSREYMREKVSGPLGTVLKAGSPMARFEAQDRLWTVLIEGDARFKRSSAADQECLIYWGPASSAVLKKLREVVR